MLRYLSLLLWVMITLGFLSGTASAFPLRTTSPGTGVFEGGVAVARGIFINKSQGNTQASALVVPVLFNYSPTTNTAFGLVVPYVHKSLEVPGIGKESTDGLGDVIFRARYRFYKSVGLRRQTQAAFQMAVKLPTGSTSRGVDPRVPEIARRNLQPGTGSYDFIFDLSWLKQVRRFGLGTSLAYRLNTKHQSLQFGNQFFVNLDLEYILLPIKYPGNELILLLEGTFVHEEKTELNGQKVPSGGDQLFLAPGLQYIVSENLLLEASFQFPLWQDTQGTTPQIDYNLLLGFRYVW